MCKPLTYTAHALVVIKERELVTEWIETAIADPDWVHTDPFDPEIERRFRAIPQREGRILRVACVETPSAIRVISVFFDRGARRPK